MPPRWWRAASTREQGAAMLSAERAYERRWVTLVVVCLSLTVITIDNTILNVALPTIVRDLGASGADIQWVLDAYLLAFASLLLTAGALGDKYGRKGALTIGVVIFGTFSAFAAFATSPGMLIAMRGVMGIGAAFIYPTTLSILTNTFSGQERARAIGIWASVSGVGVALGPMVGGFLVEHFDWGAVFLVNVPVCAIALILGFRYIPTSRDPENRPLDPIGAALSVVALISLLYAIIQAPDAGWDSAEVLVTFGVAVVLLTVFAIWETHSDDPMIDVRVFRNARFSAASAVLTLSAFALFGSVFLLIQYFQFVLGYSPVEAGLLALPLAIGMIVTSPNAPRLVVRWGTKLVVIVGLLLTAATLLCYASDTIMSSFVGGCLVRLMFGVGLGLTSAPATESIMGSLPKARAGVGSAINDTTRETGGALGVAIIGSSFFAAYHHFADRAKGLSTASSAAVHDSVGRALERAATLPAKQGAELVGLARNSFVEAMRIAYPIAAAVVLCAVFVAWRFLPARGSDEDVAVHPSDEAREISEFEILGT
jgi:EmrB/QacA subfamily drug resistance transporter